MSSAFLVREFWRLMDPNDFYSVAAVVSPVNPLLATSGSCLPTEKSLPDRCKNNFFMVGCSGFISVVAMHHDFTESCDFQHEEQFILEIEISV